MHPSRSQAHKVARAPMATRSHSMAYKHSLCRVCWTVCGQCLCDPLCLLRWFTLHSNQCHPLGCIASRHHVSSAGMAEVHPRAHTHAHAHGVAGSVARGAQPHAISPLMCCRAPLSCTAYSCAFTGTHTAVVDIPLLPCCGTAPLALLRSSAHGPVPSITGPCVLYWGVLRPNPHPLQIPSPCPRPPCVCPCVPAL